MEMDLFNLLNLGSFFNFWYWLFVAVTWSRLTYFILNVPLHEARYAARHEGNYMTDFQELMRINVDRHIEVFDQYGTYLVAISAFFLATIGTLGFTFKFELMQAFTFLLCGIAVASAHSIAFAYRLRRAPVSGVELCNAFYSHRRMKQVIGILFIFVTSFYAVIRHAVLVGL